MEDQDVKDFELCRTEAAMVTVMVRAQPGVTTEEVDAAMARATGEAHAAVV